jgi:hypothetical protein
VSSKSPLHLPLMVSVLDLALFRQNVTLKGLGATLAGSALVIDLDLQT